MQRDCCKEHFKISLRDLKIYWLIIMELIKSKLFFYKILSILRGINKDFVDWCNETKT